MLFLVAPEVSVMEREVYAAGGEVVVMSCVISASPLYDAYWTKGSDINGKRIKTDWKYIVRFFFVCLFFVCLFVCVSVLLLLFFYGEFNNVFVISLTVGPSNIQFMDN